MEKRNSQRKRVVLAGKMMMFGGGLIDCRVRDLSDTGARLKVTSIVGVPETFTLHIDGREKTHTSEVVWRKETEVGVRFLPA